jgi:EAL domain-containing protein (putative c-di-GMP-specific phosphodiesterase class I)
MTEQFNLLRDQGVGLQLDDFGTGYSSLSYLLRYPLDVVKIDRSFVAGLHQKEHSRAIVKATLAMAESLDMEVVAEGVETEEELHCLVGLGCRSAQGYLLGRPMPCDEFERLLVSGRVAIPRPQRVRGVTQPTLRPDAAVPAALSA